MSNELSAQLDDATLARFNEFLTTYFQEHETADEVTIQAMREGAAAYVSWLKTSVRPDASAALRNALADLLEYSTNGEDEDDWADTLVDGRGTREHPWRHARRVLANPDAAAKATE